MVTNFLKMLVKFTLSLHTIVEGFFGILFAYNPSILFPVKAGTSEYDLWRILGVSIITQAIASCLFLLNPATQRSALFPFAFYHIGLECLFLSRYNWSLGELIKKRDFVELLHLAMSVLFLISLVFGQVGGPMGRKSKRN